MDVGAVRLSILEKESTEAGDSFVFSYSLVYLAAVAAAKSGSAGGLSPAALGWTPLTLELLGRRLPFPDEEKEARRARPLNDGRRSRSLTRPWVVVRSSASSRSPWLVLGLLGGAEAWVAVLLLSLPLLALGLPTLLLLLLRVILPDLDIGKGAASLGAGVGTIQDCMLTGGERLRGAAASESKVSS